MEALQDLSQKLDVSIESLRLGVLCEELSVGEGGRSTWVTNRDHWVHLSLAKRRHVMGEQAGVTHRLAGITWSFCDCKVACDQNTL